MVIAVAVVKSVNLSSTPIDFALSRARLPRNREAKSRKRMNLGNFLAELKRRHVYKAAIAYAVFGWLLIQIATQVFPFFAIPNWIVRFVVLIIILGFPIALVIAW